MKLDNNRSKQIPEPVSEERQAKKEIHYTLLANYVKRVDGGRIFKINKETKEVSEALFRAGDTYSSKDNGTADKVDVEKGFWYVEALNIYNAFKKLKQGKIILST